MPVQNQLHSLVTQPIFKEASELKKELHSYVTMDPKTDAESHKFYSNLYRVAAIASVVAFVIFGVAIVTVLALTNPLLIPFAVFGLGSLSVPLTSIYNSCKTKSIEQRISYQIDKETFEIIEEMENWSDPRLYVELFLATPQWNKSSLPTQAYIPVLARHNYWKKTAAKVHEKVQKCLTDANTLRNQLNSKRPSMSATQISSMEKEIKQFREIAYLTSETEEVPAKVKGAFMLYVLKNPLKLPENGTLVEKDIGDFGQWKIMSLEDRLLLNTHDYLDPIFTKSEGTDIRKDWILNHSFQEISRAIFN